jgi:hypothetical protein
MPQFDYNPAGPKTQVLGDPNSGKTVTLKKKKGKRKPEAQAPYKAPKDQPAQGAASSGASAGGRGAGSGGGRGGNNNNQQSNAPAAYNPLTAEFKTPAQLRKEAAELAALSVASEDILRQQQAREEAGLTGLTSALSGRLGDIAAQQRAGLQGFGSLYGRLAGSAQTAGGAALAAAGADPGLAAGANPLVAGQLANLSAPLMGYQPAAEAIGQRLIGASQGALGKALMERSAQLSANTAKYLRDLQDTEIQRAISQGTLAQNEARLGLTAEENEWERQVDAARIQQGNQRLSIQAQKAAAQIQKDLAKSTADAAKNIKDAKGDILLNVQKWTKPKTVKTGEYNWKITIGDNTYSSTGRTVDEAKRNLGSAIDQAVEIDGYTQGREVSRSVVPNNEDVIRVLQPILVNAGMTPRNARAWILTNVLRYSPSSPAPSGAFMGGVGGTVA